MHHPTDRIIHTTAFVTPVVEHWLEREIALINTCFSTQKRLYIRKYTSEMKMGLEDYNG